MNILYIEHYAGSPEMGMEFRPYYLSREWIKMGYEVNMIAADYTHLRLKNPKVQNDFQEEEIDGIHYHWVRTSEYSGNGLGRVKNMLQFVGKLFFNAKVIAARFKPDIIITSSTYPLDTYVGQRIKKYCPSAKLIHEIHDMWPAVLTEVNGLSKYHPLVIMMQLAENSFCRNSDYVVSLPPCSKQYLMRHGMKEEKFLDVSNGVNIEDWTNPETLNEATSSVIKELKAKGKFVICFFGSITNYYALPELIEAVQSLEDPNVAVVFVGAGVYKKHLMELAEKKTKDRFYFLNKIPKKQVPELLKMVDALYVGGIGDSVFKYGICMNKLFDSMMSSKPLLYAVDAPNNYILDYKCGISVPAGDSAALAEGIKKIISMSQEERDKLGKNGHEAVMNHFTYPKLALKFASLF